jgi:hypothetical protein
VVFGIPENDRSITASRFDALMRTYEQLAEYVLATLRIDTRCRTIHFLDLAMRRVSGLTEDFVSLIKVSPG